MNVRHEVSVLILKWRTHITRTRWRAHEQQRHQVDTTAIRFHQSVCDAAATARTPTPTYPMVSMLSGALHMIKENHRQRFQLQFGIGLIADRQKVDIPMAKEKWQRKRHETRVHNNIIAGACDCSNARPSEAKRFACTRAFRVHAL